MGTLSPLLFVIVAELLQIIIHKAASLHLFKPPITHNTDDCPIVQYADDNLLILQADADQLVFLQALLQSFSDSTGLKVNHRKS